MIKLCFILVFIVFAFSYGKPLPGKAHRPLKPSASRAPGIKSNVDALKFLSKFGYNECGGSGSVQSKDTGPLCQSSFQTMLEHFQTVFHLPVTGKLDDKTLNLMNKPRCSLGDYPMGYSAFRPWPNTTLKWKLNNQIPTFGREKTRIHLQEAFDDWARYAPLKFREAVGDEQAEFSISFNEGNHDDGFPFDGAGGTLAHAFFPKDGKVHFDSAEEWTDKYDGFGYNFRLVASHEIGHALGLAHSYDQTALMYPFYQLMQPKDLLPKDDRDGIRALYGNNEDNQPTTFASTTAKPLATTTTTTTRKKKTTAKGGKTTKTTTRKPQTTQPQVLAHDRCARYMDVVFGGGPDKWLYTLDYDLVWRYHPDFGHWDTSGIPITDVFQGAEPHMMAGILSPVTKKIYLFKGYRVWRFSSPNSLDSGFPRRLFGTGTPYNPIAALYEKGHIWLLKGGLLFKFHEDKLIYEFDRPPKRISEQFPGVPKNVRTAFTYDGKHYFFTEPDRNVYVFDTKTKRIESDYPKPMTTGWFACQEKSK
ncbi:unnamed protein product [Rotaria magnacalcarata]|nr:unnamed protein product [Rotaria magnacalcarata]CAF2083779.1 unnamed protein product [Rotaria magnacalcarata]CAF2117418.1 unnamed protein product [Rotaria magnacalcarata]CAF4078981.1 unnamed protein product [Rotaria magnacalcarata]